MSVLKTLKDLNLNYEDIWDFEKGTPEEILKQEAIKWRNNIPQLWEEWFKAYRKSESKKEKRLFGEWLLDKIFNLKEK